MESSALINTMDPIGVSMAAIQGLYQVVKEKDDRIAGLEKQVQRLEDSVRILKQTLVSDQGRVAQLSN